MTGLLVHDSIKVLTQNGECKIDLCLGDITKLRQQDKVDVIMISAFRGDYAPTPTSLIGSLKRNLKLNVRDLARNKAEDLRNLYSCWWSHPLPNDLPYKRLLCFETQQHSHLGRPQEMVANVYRCLVPILNNEDGTVITPLLNTGDQGYSQVTMLQGMVIAAVNWMKAGLPLRLLKIVLYAKVSDEKVERSATMRSYENVCSKFAALKERYDSQYLVPKAVAIEFDIYLSYSDDDKDVVESIQKRLKTAKSDIRIYGSKQEIDSEAVWQQDMYQVMMRSAKVVTVLSPHYLKSTACIEQYNIALCCNRRAHRDMLAPFYVDSIELMPTYMGLVQYVDCRPNDNLKINDACEALVSLTVTAHLETLIVDPAPIQYDIFISYSHRDDKIANSIVKLLQKLDPKLKVFFDIQELKTGKAWQRALYHSIDGSRCMLALISKNYTRSPVCQEEYNLALAKHCSGDGSMQLIPICIEEVEKVPATFSKVKMVKATPDVFDSVVSAVCKAVVNWLTSKDVDPDVEHILKHEENPLCDMDKISADQRRADFTVKYGSKDKQLLFDEKQCFPTKLQRLKKSTSPVAASKSDEVQEVVDIVFSCAEEDEKYTLFLKTVIENAAPGLVIKTTFKSEKDRLTLMDTAHCVVPLLSSSYLDSPEQVEEFHIALCRQRISPTTVLFPITVQPVPQKPTYFHIVPTSVNITDSLWPELAYKWKVNVPILDLDHLRKEIARGIKFPSNVALALHEAASILIKLLQSESAQAAGDDPFRRPVLHNVLQIEDGISPASSKDQAAAAVELDKMLITLNISGDEVTMNMLKEVTADIDSQELPKDASLPNIEELGNAELTTEQSTDAEPSTSTPKGDSPSESLITEPTSNQESVANPDQSNTQESSDITQKYATHRSSDSEELHIQVSSTEPSMQVPSTQLITDDPSVQQTPTEGDNTTQNHERVPQIKPHETTSVDSQTKHAERPTSAACVIM